MSELAREPSTERLTNVIAGAPAEAMGMSVNSVFPQLEQLLPQVSKPIQYVGG